MRVFDIHTHLLPGIDDGARDKEQSRQMISSLKEQGVTDVFLTPHFYHYEMSLEKFVEKRHKAFLQVSDFFVENNIKPYLGAEVYFVDTIFRYDDISELCIDKGDYILIEIPFNGVSSEKVISMLYKMCANYSVNPIIAHIEKYPEFFNRKFLEELKEIGCLVQFDIDSLKKYFIRKKLIKYIQKGLIQLAGSDCHNLSDRKPDFCILKKYLQESMVKYLFNNGYMLF